MDKLYKIVNLNRPVIYIAVTVLMLLPLIKPLGLPLPVGEVTKQYKQAIDDLSPGDVMWINCAVTVEMANELVPGLTATAHYAYDKGVNIVLFAPAPAGAEFTQAVTQELIDKGAVYGENVVNLGFLPGDEPTIASFLGDVHKTAPADYKGTSLASLPMMKDIKSGRDIAVTVVVTGDASAPDMYARQIGPFANMKLLFSSQGTLWPKIQTYLPTNQVHGALNGARGAAEFESITDQKGRAMASMDATSAGWLIFVGLVIFGNLAQFLEPKKTDGGKGDSK